MNQSNSANYGSNIGGIDNTFCEHLINNKLCIIIFMYKLPWGAVYIYEKQQELIN